MDSILERKKLLKEKHEDRMSNLPDSLIGQILSYLPTKYAVSTCVLSTRWKQLWTSIISLDIDDDLLSCSQIKQSSRSLQRSFTTFVSRVLSHHVSSVQRFRLKCSLSSDASLVNGWIAGALLLNVRELDLDLRIWMEDSCILPPDLFTCRTLVVLKLRLYGGDKMINVPASVSLPNLRMLHLSTMKFVNDNSINRFLSGCRVLEELSMSGCHCREDVSVINIVAPTLTSLIIDDGLYPPLAFEHKIVLDTPAILYLTIHIFAKRRVYLVEKNLHHLIRADIHINDASPKALADLLKRMSNVQFLSIGGFMSQYTDLPDGQLPKFPNMTCLELCHGVGWEFLLKLLENTEHLETLVLKNMSLEDLGSYYAAWNVPSCFLSHLKVIEIENFFYGKKEEWEIVDYFLRNMKVLEKVNIVCAYTLQKLTLPRTSDVAVLQRWYSAAIIARIKRGK